MGTIHDEWFDHGLNHRAVASAQAMEIHCEEQLAQSKLPCHVIRVVVRGSSELAKIKVARPRARSWSAKLKVA